MARDGEAVRGRVSRRVGFAIENEIGHGRAPCDESILEDRAAGTSSERRSNAARWVADGRDGPGWSLTTRRRSRPGGVPSRRRPGGDVADADAVDRAVRTLGANLLVVEPAGKSILLDASTSGDLPSRRCPAARFGEPPSARRAGRDEDRRGDRPGHAARGHPGPAEAGRFVIALPMPLEALCEGRRPDAARRSSPTTTWAPAPRCPDRPERGPRGGQPVRQDQDADRRLLRVPAGSIDL